MKPPDEALDRSTRDQHRARNALRVVDQITRSQRQTVMAKIIIPAKCRSVNAGRLRRVLDLSHARGTTTLLQAKRLALDAYHAMRPTDQADFTLREEHDLQRCLNLPMTSTNRVDAELLSTRDLLYRARDAWRREANYRAAKQLLPTRIVQAESLIQRRIAHHDRLVQGWIRDRQRKELDTLTAFQAMSSTNQRLFKEWYGDLFMLLCMGEGEI